MGKARRLIALAQRKEFFLAVGGTFAVILGLASAVLTVIGRHFELIGTLVVVAITLFVSCVWHYRRIAIPQVAVDDVLATGGYDDPQTHLRCPCDLRLANEAKRLAGQCYPGSISIAPDTFEQMRVKNPFILSCLTTRSGEFLGYFDAIPLSEPLALSFLRGTTTEAQITHEDVLSADQMNSCKYLFISGFAVREPHAHAGRRNASILAWAILRYLDAFYASTSPLVFALAATKAGDELMQRFKLNLQGNPIDRLDGYRLYSLVLTHDEITRRLACLPDWERICLLDWSAPKLKIKGEPKPRRPSPPILKALNLEARSPKAVRSR